MRITVIEENKWKYKMSQKGKAVLCEHVQNCIKWKHCVFSKKTETAIVQIRTKTHCVCTKNKLKSVWKKKISLTNKETMFYKGM